MLIALGWIGNLFIVAGLYGVGNRWRGAFLLSVFGELLYIARSGLAGDWSLFAVCWVFLLMAARSYYLWGKTPAERSPGPEAC